MESVKAGKINIPVIKGDTGETGQIDSISIEMIGTNEEARVDNTGTKSNAKLKLYIPKGTSIDDLSIDGFGDLIVILSNGQTIDCGRVKGEKGEKGDPASVEEYGIFYWDGKSSDDNPSNIELWQKIIDLAMNKTVSVIVGDSGATKPCFFHIDSVDVNNLKSGGNVISNIVDLNNEASSDGCYTSYILKYTNIEIQNDIVTKVNAISNSKLNSNNFLPTNKDTVKSYTPTYDYHPATKKYVDDNIKEAISKSTGLTPEIVEQLPEVGNINTIYLVLNNEISTGNNTYDEYLYINGKYELIGNTGNMSVDIDLSQYAKKDDIPLIYYWDGKTSIQNPENIELFQKIVDKHLVGKDILIIAELTGRTFVFQFLSKLKLNSVNKYTIYSNYYPKYANVNTGAKMINSGYYSLSIVAEDNIVSTITISEYNYSGTTVLACDSSIDNNYFTPTHKSQPISKGYLDDVLDSITKIAIGTDAPQNGEDIWFQTKSGNLIDNSQIIAGRGINISGEEVEDSNFNISNYIPVKSEDNISFILTYGGLVGGVNTSHQTLCFYDNDYNLVEAQNYLDETKTLSVKQDGYFRFSYPKYVTSAEIYLNLNGKIYIKQNGEYKLFNNFEEIYPNIYSTEEVQIGYWVKENGEKVPFYQKIVTVTVPQVSTDGTYVGINHKFQENVDFCVIEWANLISATGQKQPLPYISNSGLTIKAFIDTDNGLYVASNGIAYNNSNIMARILYTKTID